MSYNKLTEKTGNAVAKRLDGIARAFRANPLLIGLELLGTLASIVGTLIMTFMSPTPPLLLVFSSWTVGASSFLATSYMRGSGVMTFMMLFNLVMHLLGIMNVLWH